VKDWVNVPEAVCKAIHSSHSAASTFPPSAELKAASLCQIEKDLYEIRKGNTCPKKIHVECNIFTKLKTLGTSITL